MIVNNINEYIGNTPLVKIQNPRGNQAAVVLVVPDNPHYICLDQFKNISNPKAHYQGTGKEIVEDFRRANRKIDAFVAAIGSGGTLTGAGRKIKEEYKDALIIGVQPEGCDILNKKFVPHRIQAIAVGVVTPFLNKKLLDKMCSIRFEEAVYWMKYLACNSGLLVGISSGANIAAAMKIAEELGKNKNVVTVAPDSGRSYLETWTGE